VPTTALPSQDHNQTRWQADGELAAQLQAALPEDAMVFQLPVGTFPAELPVGELGANDLFGPALAGDDSLRWTVGAMKGSAGDWQRTLAAQPTATLVDQLAAGGVDALVLDRRGLQTDPDRVGLPAGVERELTRSLGAPEGTTTDGTRSWWDLRGRRAELVERLGVDRVDRAGDAALRPVGVVVNGSPGVRSTLDPRARHLAAESSIELTDHGRRGGPVLVSFTLAGQPGALVRLVGPDGEREVELADRPVPVEMPVQLAPGATATIELRTDAAPLGEVAAWGDLRLRLAELSVVDPDTALLGPAAVTASTGE
jgi:hypothetical protein